MMISGLLLAVSLSGCDPRTWLICSLGACGADFDQSRPLQPKQVRAVGFSHGVQLDWAPNPDADLHEYLVLRSTSAAGPFEEVGHPDVPSYRDSGLANGTTYFYIIRAVDSQLRESPDSETVHAAVRGDLAPPPPTGLTAVAGDGFVELMWGASFTAAKYKVYRGTAEAGPRVGVSTRSSTDGWKRAVPRRTSMRLVQTPRIRARSWVTSSTVPA